jgi:hypothetical protein
VTGVSRAAFVQVARRPRLWLTAWSQWRALGDPKWWARWPPVPGPAVAYMAFRLEAMHGSPKATLSEDELVAYLEWCRRMRSLAR